MPATVTLYIRIRRPEGGYTYAKPAYGKNNRLLALQALVGGTAVHHPEAVYCLRYSRGKKRIWEPVGKDPALALSKLADREKIEAAVASALAAGVRVVEPKTERSPEPLPPSSETQQRPSPDGPRPLARAIDAYLEQKKHKAKTTYAAYKRSLEIFLTTCDKRQVSEVDRNDIFKYIDTLARNGSCPRTRFNRVSNVLTFLRRQGVKDLLDPSEMPSYTEKAVKAYGRAQMQGLLGSSTEDEKMLFSFFLITGCRDEEVVHACWEDIDWEARTYSVREKKEYGFEPKGRQEREIPVTDDLLQMLREYRERHPGSRLMFPREDGQPNHHLLRIVKKSALATGLNCGHCVSKNGQTCKLHPVCSEWDLHRFRKTFATMHAKNGAKIHDISRWLGHADLETTLAYLATADLESEEVRTQVNATFANVFTSSNPHPVFAVA